MSANTSATDYEFNATRSVEELLSEEIRTTRARLEALQFAYDLLTGARPLPLVAPSTNGHEAVPPPRNCAIGGERRRYSDEEKHAIVDRAHELRSMSKAAEESGASVASIHLWNKGQGRGLPGAKLSAAVAEDLRR